MTPTRIIAPMCSSADDPDGYDKKMGVNYGRHGIELCRASEEDLAIRFNRDLSELSGRFAINVPLPRSLFRMHQRHGQTVSRPQGTIESPSG